MPEEFKDHAIPGDTTGTEAKEFGELFPPIESTAPYLRCTATGVLYPNQPPFTDRSDILKPHWPKDTAATVVTASPEVATPDKTGVAITPPAAPASIADDL